MTARAEKEIAIEIASTIFKEYPHRHVVLLSSPGRGKTTLPFRFLDYQQKQGEISVVPVIVNWELGVANEIQLINRGDRTIAFNTKSPELFARALVNTFSLIEDDVRFTDETVIWTLFDDTNTQETYRRLAPNGFSNYRYIEDQNRTILSPEGLEKVRDEAIRYYASFLPVEKAKEETERIIQRVEKWMSSIKQLYRITSFAENPKESTLVEEIEDVPPLASRYILVEIPDEMNLFSPSFFEELKTNVAKAIKSIDSFSYVTSGMDKRVYRHALIKEALTDERGRYTEEMVQEEREREKFNKREEVSPTVRDGALVSATILCMLLSHFRTVGIEGNPGTGKTTSARAIAEAMQEFLMSQNIEAFSACYTPAEIDVNEVSIAVKENNTARTIYHAAFNGDIAGITVLDEAKYFPQDVLKGVINILNNPTNNRAIILTYNPEDMSPEEFAESLQQRIFKIERYGLSTNLGAEPTRTIKVWAVRFLQELDIALEKLGYEGNFLEKIKKFRAEQAKSAERYVRAVAQQVMTLRPKDKSYITDEDKVQLSNRNIQQYITMLRSVQLLQDYFKNKEIGATAMQMIREAHNPQIELAYNLVITSKISAENLRRSKRHPFVDLPDEAPLNSIYKEHISNIKNPIANILITECLNEMIVTERQAYTDDEIYELSLCNIMYLSSLSDKAAAVVRSIITRKLRESIEYNVAEVTYNVTPSGDIVYEIPKNSSFFFTRSSEKGVLKNASKFAESLRRLTEQNRDKTQIVFIHDFLKKLDKKEIDSNDTWLAILAVSSTQFGGTKESVIEFLESYKNKVQDDQKAVFDERLKLVKTVLS